MKPPKVICLEPGCYATIYADEIKAGGYCYDHQVKVKKVKK